MIWQTINETVLTNEIKLDETKDIIGFDLDNTLVQPILKNIFPRNENDWKYCFDNVKEKIKELSDTYNIVIFTNQYSLPESFKSRIENILNDIGINIKVYAAIDKDIYRKPRIGMYDLLKSEIDNEMVFYCGDAKGRLKDHSDCDLKFALNINTRFYLPEEIFNNYASPKQSFSSTRSNVTPSQIHDKFGFDPTSYPDNYHPTFPKPTTKITITMKNILPSLTDIIVCVGSPASGKSSFCKKYLTDYEYVNEDSLKTLKKCLKVTEECLKNNKRVIIDNTNKNLKVRSHYIELAKKYNKKITCVWFTTPKEICFHNNMYRNLYSGKKVPDVALRVYWAQFETPTIDEGFDKIHKIQFIPDFELVLENKWRQYLI